MPLNMHFQVSMQCLPRDLDWIGEITETSSLEGLDSGLTGKSGHMKSFVLIYSLEFYLHLQS